MRRLFTGNEGLTESALRWGERTGQWRRVGRGVWAEGADAPNELDRARGLVLATGGVASHGLAAVLHGLDSVEFGGTWVTVPPTASGRRDGTCRRRLASDRIVTVRGLACTDGLQTLVDLASAVPDPVWEHALESALRKDLTTVPALEQVMPGHGVGARRARRVLALRPEGAAPTESLLETLMVQLARTVPGLPDPQRQLWIEEAHARLDLAWPDLGLFVELDGQHHVDQPVHDARRETGVVAATGWLCGRFTWTEVTRVPRSTARRLGDLAGQGRRRPVASGRRAGAGGAWGSGG